METNKGPFVFCRFCQNPNSCREFYFRWARINSGCSFFFSLNNSRREWWFLPRIFTSQKVAFDIWKRKNILAENGQFCQNIFCSLLVPETIFSARIGCCRGRDPLCSLQSASFLRWARYVTVLKYGENPSDWLNSRVLATYFGGARALGLAQLSSMLKTGSQQTEVWIRSSGLVPRSSPCSTILSQWDCITLLSTSIESVCVLLLLNFASHVYKES